MANITVTYSFTNGTTADADQVNQNFTDVINGTSDGTKDFSINALTVAGTLTANGNVTIGNSSGDDLTVTASLASSIPIKTTRSYDIGSADLGLRILYLGGNGAHTIALQAPSASMSADYSLNLPSAAPVNGKALQATSTSATQWAPLQTDFRTVATGDYSTNVFTIADDDGYRTYLCATDSTNRTINLPTAADNTDRLIQIKKSDSGTGTLTIEGENAETVDGAANIVLYKQYESITIVCDGANWHIIDANWCSGTYTPTLTAVTNPTGGSVHTARMHYFKRISPTLVNVTGVSDFDPTLGAPTATEVGITLPIASNFASSYDLVGIGVGQDVGAIYQPAFLEADTTNDRARYRWEASATQNREHHYMFTYTII